MENKAPLLTLTNVSKHFGGLQVITDLDFVVGEEEIVGLIGPNGAGKTTVFNLITAIYRINKGSIRFKDKEITRLSPHKICHLGISRTYQLVRAFLKMSVYDNVMTAAVYGGKHLEQSPKQRALESIELVELTAKQDITAAHLTLSDRRLLEIAMGLASSPSLILLDEPMAGLNDVEIEHLLQVIKTTRDDNWLSTVDIGGTSYAVNRCDAIANFGGGELDNEECYLLVKMARALGLVYVEHCARI